MRSLDLYLFRQCLSPLVFAVAVITLIVWMTQSLQRLDILVEHGSGLALFAWLSVLIVPSLLSVIIPFALLGAALYALQRLHADSEIAVIFAAGVSRWRIAAPLLIITAAAAAATLWVNLDLMPRSYRALKSAVAELRADFASTVLRGGEFTSVIDGLTIYVERAEGGGRFEGLLVNDFREPERPEVYMAQKGLLRETTAGPILLLVNGNIQRTESDGEIEFINFRDTVVNIASLKSAGGDHQLELTERYLSELFNPDLDDPWDRENAGRLIAEGHNRLASPIYAFAYALLAVHALIGGPYSRRGHARRIALAAAGAAAMRIAGFVLQGAAAESGANWLQYALPLGAVLVLGFLISDWPRARAADRPRAPQWAAEPA